MIEQRYKLKTKVGATQGNYRGDWNFRLPLPSTSSNKDKG